MGNTSHDAMMDRPAKEELLDAVEHYLKDQLLPRAEGADAFYLRVAANMLAIVRREVTLAPESEAAEMKRLRALLQAGEATDLATLNRALADAVRSGDIAFDDPELLDHLWRTTLDKLAVDQPHYASYRRALEDS